MWQSWDSEPGHLSQKACALKMSFEVKDILECEAVVDMKNSK